MGRPKTVPREEVIRLRNAGFMGHEIADELQCGLATVSRVLKESGLVGGNRRITIERQRLLELWLSTKTLSEISVELECSVATVLRLGRQHELPHRSAFRVDPDDVVTPEEDAKSADSLRLSPWVAARIKELGLGVMA